VYRVVYLIIFGRKTNAQYFKLLKSKLESNLAQLFKCLVRFKESVVTFKNLNHRQPAAGEEEENASNRTTTTTTGNMVQVLPFHKENLKSQLDECIKKIGECASSLFDLSLLVPSAPWVSPLPFLISIFPPSLSRN
jgi:hypothetical protein